MNATTGDNSGRTLPRFSDSVRPAAISLLVTMALFVVFFWPSVAWMAVEWSGSSGLLSHGYLVVAIAGYLIVRSLHVLADSPLEPVWWLLPVVFSMSIVWLLAFVANVAAVQTMILPVMLLTTITAAFGFAVGRVTSFGVLYFYFAMPAWEHLQFIFQEITVFALHVLVRLIDIPAYVEGNLVHIPAGTFRIVGGCSGLNFVVAGLSLAILYGHLYYKGWRQKIRLVALTIAVSMIGNWLRVFIVVNIGFFKGMDNDLVTDHLTMGWVIFAVLMVPVFFVARRLESEATENVSRRSNRFPVAVSLPKNVAGWRGPMQTTWDWRPRFVGVTAKRIAEYRRNDKLILSYANVYVTQAQGKELIFTQNSILGRWRRDGGAAADKQITVERAGPFQQEMAVGPYGSWIIMHRYVIGGEPVVGNVRGKIRQSLVSLQGKPEAGVIAFAIPCAASCADAINVLTEFVSNVGRYSAIRFAVTPTNRGRQSQVVCIGPRQPATFFGSETATGR
jgi:exosortase